MKSSRDKYDTEEKLLSALKKGDERAFEILFHRYYQIVVKLCEAILDDTRKAKDIAQDVFMNVWTHRDRIIESGSFRNYIYVLAKNAAMNQLKSLPHKNEQVTDTLPEQGEEETERTIIYNEVVGRVNRCVASMPEQRQKVFKMSREEGLSEKEIANRLGLSVRTVEKHVELALKDIRQLEN